MTQPIRVGIIGCGLMGREIASAIARWCHFTNHPARPELVAIASRQDKSFDWFRSNFATVRQATTDYRELLANPEVDAVYCAVPHFLHEEFYTAVIQAGKHLLGEKPFGIDARANAVVVAEARKRPDLVVRCSSQFAFLPATKRIFAAASAGRLGRILEVECGFLHSSDMNPDKPVNWKRTGRLNGEYGCMGDLGPHCLFVPLRLGWRPRNVRAILSDIFPERPDGHGGMAPCDTWDNATLLCETEAPDGTLFPLTLKTQRIAPGEGNTWYLTVKGTRLSMRFTTKQPKTLETLAYEPGGAQAWQCEDLGYESYYPTISGSIFEFGFSDALLQMFGSFMERVASGVEAPVAFDCATAEESVAWHAVFTAALESQAKRSVVEVAW